MAQDHQAEIVVLSQKGISYQPYIYLNVHTRDDLTSNLDIFLPGHENQNIARRERQVYL
jgi:hypothetical protein